MEIQDQKSLVSQPRSEPQKRLTSLWAGLCV